jgi:hypothetical protein
MIARKKQLFTGRLAGDPVASQSYYVCPNITQTQVISFYAVNTDSVLTNSAQSIRLYHSRQDEVGVLIPENMLHRLSLKPGETRTCMQGIVLSAGDRLQGYAEGGSTDIAVTAYGIEMVQPLGNPEIQSYDP